ncbi:transposase [Burkholderia sp. Ac-20365]|uniref:transposase n=1 Tax=Burkholderia sp. Ac-20365 TaxID=2703897 RepID=UPI00197B8785|nr:transposase [Burkholderia sp. Ac-20365]MBN3762323.1 transposase [Burkholderia sp. Ac-20365]
MWFDRIERSNGKFMIVDISLNSGAKSIDIEQAYHQRLSYPERRYLRATTNFSSWSQSSPKRYAKVIGITKDVTEHHTIYSFEYASKTILLPSWILQMGLFSPPYLIFPYLYSIYGLDFLCFLQENETGTSVELADARHKHLILENPTHALERLIWFRSFPSANRAWKSVYRSATKGNISLDLPNANITCSVNGKLIDDTLFADRFLITTLQPTEPPMDWANAAPREFCFDARNTREVESNRSRDLDFLRPDGSSALSDREWQAIQSVLPPIRGYHSVDENRLVLDLILKKLAEGLPWRTICKMESGEIAYDSYYKLKSKGWWSRFKKELLKCRRNIRSDRRLSIGREGGNNPTHRTRLRDIGFPPRKGALWTVSDAEWKSIVPILFKSQVEARDSHQRYRFMVDSIIIKLGTGRTWAEVASSRGLSRTTLIRFFGVIKCDGRWAEVRSFLCSNRFKGHA